MSKRSSENTCKWFEDIFELNVDFRKSYNDESDKTYFLGVDVYYPENLHNLHNDLPFLPERMKIERVEKHIANLHEKTEYFTHIKNFKKALSHALLLKKVHIIIRFNEKS